MKNDYEVRGDITAIFINSKKFGPHETIISTVQLEKVKCYPYSWYLQKMNDYFYIVGALPGKGGKTPDIPLHRYLTNAPSGKVVDHINRNTFDNTDSNLRILTVSENLQNRNMNKNNTSGYRGVSWHNQTNKWIARVRYDGKARHLGLFDDIEEANKVATEARLRHLPFTND